MCIYKKAYVCVCGVILINILELQLGTPKQKFLAPLLGMGGGFVVWAVGVGGFVVVVVWVMGVGGEFVVVVVWMGDLWRR